MTTGEKVARIVGEHAPEGAEFDVVSNPEFLREGSAVTDFFEPDRIVIGSNSPRASEVMWKIYETFPGKRLETDLNSAEIIKHAANSFLALKISFINAVAAICDAANADVTSVADGIGLDERIGRAFLHAGLGYGGSCFPKDIQAFLAVSKEVGAPFNLLQEIVDINDAQQKRMLEKMRQSLGTLEGKRIAVWGIAFKSNTDDIRESVAVKLIKQLVEEKANVSAYDEKGAATFQRIEGDYIRDHAANLEIADSAFAAAKDADAILIATEWPEFRDCDLAELKATLANPVVFDGRNLHDPAKMLEMGFEYHAVGRAGAIAKARASLS